MKKFQLSFLGLFLALPLFLAASNQPPLQVSKLVLTGIFDGPLPGGSPKGVEIYVIEDITDLSAYGVGSANNGGGSNGVEYTFPAVSVTAGDFIYLTTDSAAFVAFFGFSADFVQAGSGSAVNINGDDAIELFENGVVVDIFGDINTDGTGTDWDYLDGWAYRINITGPDGSTFIQNNWIMSGIDALDNETSNATAQNPFPLGTYRHVAPMSISASDDNVNTQQNAPVSFNPLDNDFLPNDTFNLFEIVTQPASGAATAALDGTITYTPNQDFCGQDQLSYAVCFNADCDTAVVNIEVECPITYPRYTIPVIRANNINGEPDLSGSRCEVEAIVYGGNINPPNGFQFTIIDDANNGVAIFNNSKNFGYTVTEGDQVIVRGVINHFRGLTQINADTVILVSQNNGLIDADVVTALDESTESSLVLLENLKVDDPSQWTNAGSGFTVKVSNTFGIFDLRVDKDVNVFGTQPPTGRFNLTGIGGQFDSTTPLTEGYQILPRYVEDIEIISSVTTPEWALGIRSYPNPATEFLQIELGNYEGVVRIVDERGAIIRTLPAQRGQINLNLNGFSAGLYFIQFEKEGQMWQNNFVKK